MHGDVPRPTPAPPTSGAPAFPAHAPRIALHPVRLADAPLPAPRPAAPRGRSAPTLPSLVAGPPAYHAVAPPLCYTSCPRQQNKSSSSTQPPTRVVDLTGGHNNSSNTGSSRSSSSQCIDVTLDSSLRLAFNRQERPLTSEPSVAIANPRSRTQTLRTGSRSRNNSDSFIVTSHLPDLAALLGSCAAANPLAPSPPDSTQTQSRGGGHQQQQQDEEQGDSSSTINNSNAQASSIIPDLAAPTTSSLHRSPRPPELAPGGSHSHLAAEPEVVSQNKELHRCRKEKEEQDKQ